MAVLNELISALLQLLVFSLIPFIVFLFRKDKSVSFFQYIGLYRPTGRSIALVLLAAALVLAAGMGLTFFNEGFRQALLSPNSVTGKLKASGTGASTFVILLIIALIKTSLAEEILFRGFIAKRLISLLGFNTGNILQALIFAALHGALFYALTPVSAITVIIIFLFSGTAGWLLGYIKEKTANGSIIPGWVAHGLGNTIAYSVVVYLL